MLLGLFSGSCCRSWTCASLQYFEKRAKNFFLNRDEAVREPTTSLGSGVYAIFPHEGIILSVGDYFEA